MTCDTRSRGRTSCAPAQLPTLDPDVGQIVHLKSEPGKTYVVTAVICERSTALGENPVRIANRFRVCCTEGFSRNTHEVGICELTHELFVSLDTDKLPIAAEEDGLDHLTKPSADPFVTFEQATIAFVRPTGGTIDWEAADPRGEAVSRDARFMIRKGATLWQAFDFDRREKSFTYGDRAAAVSWCEIQVKLGENNLQECDALGAHITPTLPSTIEWATRNGTGVLFSPDDRFSIHSLMVQGEEKWFATDHQSVEEKHRLSPNGSFDEAKTWCEQRSRFQVVISGGEESLAPVEDLNNTPF